MTVLTWLHAKLGMVPLVILALGVLYALYVVKMHLGIDIFRHWGLHLPGPRTAIRLLARKLDIS